VRIRCGAPDQEWYGTTWCTGSLLFIGVRRRWGHNWGHERAVCAIGFNLITALPRGRPTNRDFLPAGSDMSHVVCKWRGIRSLL
jgi:hypothetical protein